MGRSSSKLPRKVLATATMTSWRSWRGRFALKPGDYNLSDYVRHKVIGSTSANLLNLLSSLVSEGAITKPSVTIAQCIQQHIYNAGRNTTLGLVAKLHHKHGSSELIKTPNEHGITRIDVGSDNILLLYVSYVLVILGEPTSASNDSSVCYRVTVSVCGSHVQSTVRRCMAVASPRERQTS